MIKSFCDSETEKIWNGKKSSKLPPEIHKRAFAKLLIIHSAESEEDLKIPPGNKFELPKIGDILVEEFLEPLEITPYRLAKDLGVSTSSILDLVHNRRKISVEMSLRLSKYFGTTSKF